MRRFAETRGTRRLVLSAARGLVVGRGIARRGREVGRASGGLVVTKNADLSARIAVLFQQIDRVVAIQLEQRRAERAIEARAHVVVVQIERAGRARRHVRGALAERLLRRVQARVGACDRREPRFSHVDETATHDLVAVTHGAGAARSGGAEAVPVVAEVGGEIVGTPKRGRAPARARPDVHGAYVAVLTAVDELARRHVVAAR